MGWTPPPQPAAQPPPPAPEVDEASLAFKRLEIERQPRMAKRLGYIEVTINGAALGDAARAVDDIQLLTSSVYKDEIERRPRSARRQGLIKPASTKVNVRDLQLVDSAVYAEEIQRRPSAARRLGLVESAAEPVVLPPPAPFSATAAAATERARRPAAAARLFGRLAAAPLRPGALSPGPALRDTAAHDLEVARRPRAAARLRARPASSHPELADGQAPEFLGGTLSAEVDARRLALSAELAVRSLGDESFDAAQAKAEAALHAAEEAAAAAGRSPFAALERALEERLAAGAAELSGSEGRVRGSGAAALAGLGDGPGPNAGSRGGSFHNGRAGSRGGSTHGGTSRGGSTHGGTSRGGSLRGGRNIWGSAQNLQAQAQWWSQELRQHPSYAAAAGATVQEAAKVDAAAVACELVKGNVVCRNSNGEVVMRAGAEADGDVMVCLSPAASGTGDEACIPVD